MIQSVHFYDLLECLAGQFFTRTKDKALCTGNDFGSQIALAAKDYFSIAIIPEQLPDNRAVVGVLIDDSAHNPKRNGYTFAIYVDTDKIPKPTFKVFASIILSHEICHFAFYYELFLWLGGNTGVRVQADFTHEISTRLMSAITVERDTTSETVFDEHNLRELVDTFGKYDKSHFAKGNNTLLDYSEFFNNFLTHLDFDTILRNV